MLWDYVPVFFAFGGCKVFEVVIASMTLLIGYRSTVGRTILEANGVLYGK